ncbi:RICIN domain-containing protein [Streptomyces lasalocidi]
MSGTAVSSRTLLTGVGLASAGLLATVLVISMWPNGGDGTDPVASTSVVPGSDGRSAPGSAGLPTSGRSTRLRNADSDLCLDIRGTPKAGAGAVLAVCSSAVTQQWTYGPDGLLRSATDSALCLDSHADAGVVILGTCAEEGSQRAADVRYDRTAQGELLTRWDRTLALAGAGAAPGADLVVKVRDRSARPALGHRHAVGEPWLPVRRRYGRAFRAAAAEGCLTRRWWWSARLRRWGPGSVGGPVAGSLTCRRRVLAPCPSPVRARLPRGRRGRMSDPPLVVVRSACGGGVRGRSVGQLLGH